MFVPVIAKRNAISKQWMAFFWMSLWYSSYPNCRMKTASVSEGFWKLKSRRFWNSHRQCRNTTSLKRSMTSWKRILQRRQEICEKQMAVSSNLFKRICKIWLKNWGKRSGRFQNWMRVERTTWLPSVTWKWQKKGCSPLRNMQKMRSRRFWSLWSRRL